MAVRNYSKPLNMTDFLPLFPLQLVVFPGEDLNLHIFEPRYRQLVREVEEHNITFGIPAFIDGKVVEIGTEVELLEVAKRYPNGEMDIRTRGLGVFRILEFYRQAPGKLYSGADIQRFELSGGSDYPLNEKILEFLQELFSLLNIRKELPDDPRHFQTFDVAHHAGFSIEQEYELLCLPKEQDRQLFMLAHLEQLLPTVKEVDNLRKRAQMNGHFKNIIPPEL